MFYVVILYYGITAGSRGNTRPGGILWTKTRRREPASSPRLSAAIPTSRATRYSTVGHIKSGSETLWSGSVFHHRDCRQLYQRVGQKGTVGHIKSFMHCCGSETLWSGSVFHHRVCRQLYWRIGQQGRTQKSFLAVLRIRNTMKRIRVFLFTLMWIRIRPFPLMRIRNRILLLMKVMLFCVHWSTDPPRLHFGPLRPSIAPFWASTAHELNLMRIRIHANLDPQH